MATDTNYRVLEFSEACGYCFNQCWMDFEDGGVYHPCCKFWMGEEGLDYCPACRTSAALQNSWRNS